MSDLEEALKKLSLRFQSQLTELEESLEWKERLNRVRNLHAELAGRALHRYDKKKELDRLIERSHRWEEERFLEVSMEGDGNGKKKYSNDRLRKIAVEIQKKEDIEWHSIISGIENAERELVVFDAETKKMEAELESKLMYIRLIDASLKAFAATRVRLGIEKKGEKNGKER